VEVANKITVEVDAEFLARLARQWVAPRTRPISTVERVQSRHF
jgi:hypothetical protein